MTDSDEFQQLLQRLQSGDDGAARELLDRYSTRLLRLADRRLSTVLRSKVDAEDVVQSVYRTFFRRHRDGELHFENWQSLWGLLSLLTLRKCAHRAEHYGAEKRDAGRERSLSSSGDSSAAWQPCSREPTPADAVQLIESIDGILQPLAERDQEIVRLRLIGHRTDEIAATVGRSRYTVQSVLRRVKKRLNRMLADAWD